MNKTRTSLESKIKQSGQAYFDKKTAHLSFQLPLNKPRPLLSRLFLVGTPVMALSMTIFVLVSILIGATQPNTSFHQTFTGIHALNQVSYPPFSQRKEAADFLDGKPSYDALIQQVNSLFRQTGSVLMAGEDNVVYSPLSAYASLALLLEAAHGDSETALVNFMQATDRSMLRQHYEHSFIDTYLEETIPVNGQSTLVAKSQQANGLFIRNDVTVDPAYLNLVSNAYFTEVFHTAFDAQGKQDIATWLNQKTLDVLDMTPEALSLNQETVMSLFNTLYLRANWKIAFDRSQHTLGTFYHTGNQSTIANVTYMHKLTPPTLYLDQPSFTLGIDHAYGDHRVVYVLPKGQLTPVDLLSPTYFPYILGAMQSQHQQETIALTIPKTITQNRLDLKTAFQSVAPAMATIFDPQTADFSRALPNAYVQTLMQHTRIDFLESGFEAAAITEANVGVTSAPQLPTRTLVLNQSFLYLIVNGQGLIMFAGVVHQPTLS